MCHLARAPALDDTIVSLDLSHKNGLGSHFATKPYNKLDVKRHVMLKHYVDKIYIESEILL